MTVALLTSLESSVSSKFQCTLHGKYGKNASNPLLLDMTISGIKMTITYISGPNTGCLIPFEIYQKNMFFFKNNIIIIGGDWNTSFDSRGSNYNIDVLNMAA
jgi:hypothetical protein